MHCLGGSVTSWKLTPRPCCGYRRLSTRPKRRRVVCVAKGAVVPTSAEKRAVKDCHQYCLGLYARPDVVFVEGSGSRVTDVEGKTYLDFSGGIAVNALGHSDARLRQAMMEQAARMMHSSNLFHSIPAIELSKRLVEHSFGDKVFLGNSGTEATEAAIKFARKWAAVQHGIDPYDEETMGPYEIVSFSGGFHGRTMGALSITPKKKIQNPFQPMLPGHQLATFNDLESAVKIVESGRTCAVIVEPIQGEAGIRLGTTEFLKGLRSLCDAVGCLLIFDEVQCGFGRTGKLWAHQHHDVTPDMMTLAKPLAGGLPIGAVVVTDRVAEAMQMGDHGSTFAGNPVVCHVANVLFDIVNDAAFLSGISESGSYLKEQLTQTIGQQGHVLEVRQSGLLIGIQCDVAVGEAVKAALKSGLVVITAGDGDVIRMAPPLNVTHEEIDECVEKLKSAMKVL